MLPCLMHRPDSIHNKTLFLSHQIVLHGMSNMDVPSEDGVIYIKYNSSVMVNDFARVKIVDSLEYDLIGEIVD